MSKSKFQLRPKFWVQDLVEVFNITPILNSNDLKNVMKLNPLWTSRCSKQKSDKTKNMTPSEFYVGPTNLQFYDYMNKNNLRYGIISDYYGLLYDNDKIDYYDVHPSEIDDKIKQALGKVIQDKAQKEGYNEIIFFNSSPVMSKPYFEMLHYSNLDIYYVTSLKLLDIINNEKTQYKLF